MCILIRSEPLAFSLYCVLTTEKPLILESRSPGCQKSDQDELDLRGHGPPAGLCPVIGVNFLVRNGLKVGSLYA